VRKSALDRYPEVAGGFSDPDCTHVILTSEEYRKHLQKISDAERRATVAEINAREQIERVQRAADREIQAAKNAAEQKVEEIAGELEMERSESAYQRGLNENLLLRTKERANADRDLRPKKAHTGYCVIYSAEREHRYKKDRRHWDWTMLWETVLQSPYSIDFTEQQARRQIWEDLFKITNNAWEIASIGINSHYKGTYEMLLDDPLWNDFYAGANVMLETYQRLRANYKSLYWEVVVVHTKPIGIVPQDMRLPAKK